LLKLEEIKVTRLPINLGATILLSLVQTCRGLDINPTEYLEDVFQRLMSHNANKLEELLSDRWLAAKQAAL
jgi:hypothetical protein